MSAGASAHWSQWDRLPPGGALTAADPEIAHLIEEEIQRQSDGLELIASENFVSPAVMEAMGSPGMAKTRTTVVFFSLGPALLV